MGERRAGRAALGLEALEEVEQCDYFTASGGVPPANTALTIEQRGRLFAVDSSGQTVGALPTSFNYLV